MDWRPTYDLTTNNFRVMTSAAACNNNNKKNCSDFRIKWAFYFGARGIVLICIIVRCRSAFWTMKDHHVLGRWNGADWTAMKDHHVLGIWIVANWTTMKDHHMLRTWIGPNWTDSICIWTIVALNSWWRCAILQRMLNYVHYAMIVWFHTLCCVSVLTYVNTGSSCYEKQFHCRCTAGQKGLIPGKYTPIRKNIYGAALALIAFMHGIMQCIIASSCFPFFNYGSLWKWQGSTVMYVWDS